MSNVICEEAINQLIKVSKLNNSQLIDNLVNSFKEDTPKLIQQIKKASSVFYPGPVVEAAKTIRMCASQLGITKLVDMCKLLETYDGSTYNSDQINSLTVEMNLIYLQACKYLSSRLNEQPDDISRYF